MQRQKTLEQSGVFCYPPEEQMKLHQRLTDARAFSAGLYSPESLTRYPPTSALYGGPYRARTDDIHGVNVALYQLS